MKDLLNAMAQTISTLQSELREARAALFTEPVDGSAWEYPVVRRLREERDHYRRKFHQAQEEIDRLEKKLEVETEELCAGLALEAKLKSEALYQAEIEAERANGERERSNEITAQLHDARKLLASAISDTWPDGLYQKIMSFLGKS